MGEMAEWAFEQAMMEEMERDFKERSLYQKKGTLRKPIRYTEQILNSKEKWVDGYGEIHKLEEMEESYLRNVLLFIYRNRHRYWVNCYNVTLIDKFKDGDEFFQKVIRKSNLWNTIISLLGREGLDFDFQIEE